MKRLAPRLRQLAVGIALGCAALAAIAAAASADPTSDYNTGLALGTQAYQYGVPLLDLSASSSPARASRSAIT